VIFGIDSHAALDIGKASSSVAEAEVETRIYAVVRTLWQPSCGELEWRISARIEVPSIHRQ
jgi:hypothetical protein